MRESNLARISMGGVILLLAAPPAFGQIIVTGLTTKTVYTDQVSFRVEPATGYDYTVELDGAAEPVDTMIVVDQPDYHELSVKRRQISTGNQESLLVQFIVRSSERENTEWGLPPWVPYPVINSAEAELAGARLQVILPQRFPRGLEIPVIVWLLDENGDRVGASGLVEAAELPGSSIQLRRGVGSAHLPAASTAGTLTYSARLRSLSTPKQIEIDASTSWTDISGDIASTRDLGENARVHLTGDLSIAPGATLTIGAGSIIRVATGAVITVNGTLKVDGTMDRPVVFLSESNAVYWGGILLKTSESKLVMNGAILTHSGNDPLWFDRNPGSGEAQRHEQPCIYLSGGAHATLTDCALIDGKGQAGHSEGSFLNMTRCLVQRFTSGGAYHDGSLTLVDSAVIEFPQDGAQFADADNDALYLSGGAHFLTRCLVGWCLDDAVDAGSGAEGSVTVTGCWMESAFHEGLAWSEARHPNVKDTVLINCGQGNEAGFGIPDVMSDHILSTGNLAGVRFGDNYNAAFAGSLSVKNSLILYNYRNIFGRTWSDWNEHLERMDIHANLLSEPDPNHPNNTVWQPEVHAEMLAPFMEVPAGPVGLAIATRTDKFDITRVSDDIPVRLSTFTTRDVSVQYTVASESGPLESGMLVFVPGETVKKIQLDVPDLASHDLIHLTLENPTNAELTGLADVSFLRTTTVSLVPAGSSWKYLAGAADQGTAWRTLAFDDGSWREGKAKLGFGSGDEKTMIDGGPPGNRYPTIYFRRKLEVTDALTLDSLVVRFLRNDGGVVYLNGTEVFRSNMPDGEIEYATRTFRTADAPTAFYSLAVNPTALVAGTNVIGVEIHQVDPTSPDLGFDLELTGIAVPKTVRRFIRGDANHDGSIDISDPVNVIFVLFAGASTDCEDALDADDDGTMSLTDAIYILSFLFRSGPPMPKPFASAGVDPTSDALGCER